MLYCAIISMQRVNFTGLPISFVASKSRNSARSSPSCLTFVSSAEVRCLRRSIQSIGGFAGFSGGNAVKCILGEFAPALRRSLCAPFLPRKTSTNSSREGWCTFSTRQPTAVSAISFLKKLRVSPSSAIIIPQKALRFS